MSRWFTILCALTVLGGAAHGILPQTTISGNVLVSLSNGMKVISTAASTYNTVFVSARNTLYKSALSLVTAMNQTCQALNKNYGSNPTYKSLIKNVTDNLLLMNQSVDKIDQEITGAFAQQVETISKEIQNIVDSLTSYLRTLGTASPGVITSTYEKCLLTNAKLLQGADVSIGRFATCLTSQTALIAKIVPVAHALIGYARLDFNSLITQISTCTRGSTTCFDTYMSSLSEEQSTVQMELKLAASLLSDTAQSLVSWNGACIELTSADVKDILQRIQTKMNSCNVK